ncbi:DUF1642 domain-containing protein [Enterococcus hirae]
MDEYSQGRYGAYKVSLKLAKRLNEQNITDKQAWDKVAEAYPESAQSLRNTLDNAVLGRAGEPQKPVVPKFVADWIELCKEKADLISCLSGSYEYGVNQYKRITEDEDWLFEADHQELVARAWLYGYEVEKEPLYEVIIGDLYLIKKFNNRNDFCFDTSRSLCTWEKSAYQLTEPEIKAIDERYWPFAVPVEEVAEG